MQGKAAERAAVQQPEYAPEQGAQHGAELAQRGRYALGRDGAAGIGRAADIAQAEQREDLLHELFVRPTARADGQERIAGVKRKPRLRRKGKIDMQRKQQEQREERAQPQQDPECQHGVPPVCRCFLSDPQIWFYYNAAARFLQAGIENGCAGKEKIGWNSAFPATAARSMRRAL